MKAKQIFITVALLTLVCSVGAQTLREFQTFCRQGQKAYIIENGDSFAIDQSILVVKPKKNIVLPNDIKQLRTSKLGFVDIEVPKGISVENYAKEIERSGRFESVEYNTKGKYCMLPNDTYYGSQWFLNSISAPMAWNITTGSSNIKLALIDSGVDAGHPDLGYGNDNYSHVSTNEGYDYVNNTIYSTPVGKHGTLVAGVVGAKTNNANGIAGVCGGNGAAGLSIIPYSVGDDSPDGNSVVYAINDAVDKGVKIINLSLKMQTTSQMDSSIVNAYNHGVTIVCSSGNGFTDHLSYPASHMRTIAVGATNQYNERAVFSNYGTGLDIVAPGMNIYTTSLNNTYENDYGTSLSSPQVSGTIALMLSIDSLLTPDSIRQILRSTATHLAGYAYSNNWNNETGYGRLNTYEAVKAVAIPNMDIVGANQLCGSEVYYVKNLPPDCSVEWSFINAPSSTDTLLQSDYPVANQCIINIENNENLNATLVAEVYEGTTLIKTLTKQVSTGWLFSGSCVIYDQNNNPRGPSFNFGNGDIIVMAKYDTAELSSSFFAQASISHTPSPDLLWWHSHFLSSIIEIKFTGSNQRTIVTGTDAVSCNNFKFTVRTFYTDPFMMNPYITSSDNMLNIAINGQVDDTEYVNSPWNIEIVNAVSDQSVYRSVIADSNNCQIDTSGWPSGIYVVRLIKNDEIYTQKVSVK